MWAFSSAGRAPPWHGGGHRFDPDKVHQLKHMGRQSPAFFVKHSLYCSPYLLVKYLAVIERIWGYLAKTKPENLKP